ncbi:MAG: hypothetical protein AB7O50_04185 [Pseudolabrys sp.]
MVAITYGVARAAVTAAKTGETATRKGFFARLFDALVAARMRQAEREIALYRYHARAWEKEIQAAKQDELPFGH